MLTPTAKTIGINYDLKMQRLIKYLISILHTLTDIHITKTFCYFCSEANEKWETGRPLPSPPVISHGHIGVKDSPVVADIKLDS